MRLMNYNFCRQTATVITASSQDPNFPASNLKNPIRSKRWRSTGVTNENVVFDLATIESIDSVVILWTKEDGVELSGSSVLMIQANATNVWTSPAVSQTLTINDTYEIASYYFSTPQNYRYWRVVIQDPGNANGYLEIGKVWLGSSINIQNAENGFKFVLNDLSVISRTAFGHVYADKYPVMGQLDLVYSLLSYTQQQYLDTAFRQNGVTDPVMVIIDETGAVYDKDHYALYGTFTQPFGENQQIYNIFTTDTITIVEIA